MIEIQELLSGSGNTLDRRRLSISKGKFTGCGEMEMLIDDRCYWIKIADFLSLFYKLDDIVNEDNKKTAEIERFWQEKEAAR